MNFVNEMESSAFWVATPVFTATFSSYTLEPRAYKLMHSGLEPTVGMF